MSVRMSSMGNVLTDFLTQGPFTIFYNQVEQRCHLQQSGTPKTTLEVAFASCSD